MSSAATVSHRKFETSPSGVSPAPRTRRTVIRNDPCPGPWDREYWRGCRRPSGSVTATETYCPGWKSGTGPSSAGTRVNDTASSASSTRLATRQGRHGRAGSTSARWYIRASAATSSQAHSQ